LALRFDQVFGASKQFLINAGLMTVLGGLFVIATSHTELGTDWITFFLTTTIILANTVRRPPAIETDQRIWVFCVCAFSLIYFIGFDGGSAGAIGELAHWLIIACHIVGDLCLIYLGKSFAVLPARRMIKIGFLYRFVRHPVYSLYVIADCIFVVIVPSARNITLLVLGAMAFLVRANLEERLLKGDISYREYQSKTRYRFIPWVF
jgi:protein-S-isoprenylcysteine O-methyltransferase Ste14